MKRFLHNALFVVFLVAFGQIAFAQPGTMSINQDVSGTYANSGTTLKGAVFQARFQENASGTSSGTRNWQFNADGYFNTWGTTAAAGVQTLASYNTTIAPNTATASGNFQGGPGYNGNGRLPATQANYYYTYNIIKGSSYASQLMSVLETSYNPVVLNTVAQSVGTSGSRLVTITTAATPAAGENIYVRYSTNSYVASTIVQATGSGTTWTASIPWQSTAVSFYVYSSNKALASINAEVTTFGQTAHDTSMLNLNNNGGTNYAWTPVAGNFIVTSSGGTFAAGIGYASLTNAAGVFAALNTAVAGTGSVTILQTGDSTAELGTNSLNASTNWTSIVLNPTGARTISGTTGAVAPLQLIDFSGADNVTFNGLNSGGNSLTISNLSTSNVSGTSTLRFIGGATSNTITNCSVLGSSTMAVGTNGGTIYFATDAVTTAGNDTNTISNNNIGPAGANLPSKAIYGSGSTTTTAIGNSGNIITNNNIYDYFGVAVASSGIFTTGGCNAWSITNNKFYQSGTRTWTTGAEHNAINIQNVTVTSGAQGFTITGNTIGFASNTGTGTYTMTGSTGSFRAIRFTGIILGTTSDISSNTIANISLTGVTSSGTSTSSPFTAILINEGLVSTNNNVIGSQTTIGSLVFSTNSTTATDVHGIYNFSSNVWTSNTNSIGSISVTNAAGSGTFAIYAIRANTGTAVTWTANSNLVGGTVANSIQLNSTGAASQVVGMQSANAPMVFNSNTVRNLTNNNGTGTTTTASVIGICHTSTTPNNTLTLNSIYNLSNSNTTLATTVTGIQFTGGASNVVTRNYIYNLTSATSSATAEINGIRIAGGTTTFSNNMITLGNGLTTSPIISGINEALGTNNVFNNSIYIGGAPTSGSGASYAFNGSQTVNARSFRDNIFVNNRSNSGATAKHYIVKVGGTGINPGGLTINNNVYYGTGTGNVFGFYAAADVANYTSWQAAIGQDANSFNDNPQYIDPTNLTTPDLHIHATNPTPIEASGVDLGVTVDYDGQTRSGLTATDIGADAGNFVSSIVVCTTPTNQPTALVTGTNTATTIAGSFTAATGTPTGYLVIRSSGAFAGTLVDGTPYPATTVIGNGTVIQSSNATSFAPTALTSNTAYNITVFSYNSGSCTGGPKYFTTSPLTSVLTTCPAAPTAFVNSAITSSSATVSFTASIAGGSAATINYTLEVTTDAAYALPISGSPFALLTATTKNLTGLTAATQYYYRVKANNGACDSVYLTGGTFATSCNPEVAPTATQTFATFTGTAPSPVCWSEATGAVAAPSTLTYVNSEWLNSTGFANVGTNVGVKTNLFGTNPGEWIVSQPIDLGATPSLYRVKYNMAVTSFNGTTAQATLGTHIVRVIISTDAGTTWTSANTIKTYTGAATYSNTSQTETIDLTGYSGVVKIAFVATTSSTTPDIDFHIDDFIVEAIPSCLSPTLTATTAITTTTATINWTASASAPANGYLYEVRTSGAAGSGATGLTTSGTVGAGVVTANVTGLSAATSYSVYVQSDCSGGNFSAWTSAGTFVSACNTPNNPTITAFTAVSATGLTVNFTAASPVPTAYVIFRSTNAAAPTPVNGTTYASGTAYPFGAGSYNCVANGTALTLAQTGLTSNTQYYYYIFSRDNTNSCSGAPYYSSGVNAGQITCPAAPTAFVNSGITTTTATVSWTASIAGGAANAITYTLEVTTDAAYALPISGSPFAVGTATTQNLTGLTSSTQYYYRVKANNITCDSVYLTGGTFTTTCDAITIYPSLTDFATYLPTICWNEGDLGDVTAGPTTVGSTAVSDWVADDYLNATGTLTGAAKMNIDTASGSEWIISPSFAIPATGLYRIKYNVGATQFASTTALTTAWEADDFVELLVSTTGTTNWTVLKTYNSANVPSNLGQIDDVDLTAYNGQTIRLAFRAFEGASNGLADIDFFVDNVTLELKPNPIVITPSPSATICSGTSTTLVASSATAYNYTWSPATGLNTTSGNTVVASPTTTTVYTVSGVLGAENTTQAITVVVNPAPAAVTISPSVSVCQNAISTLTATSQTAGNFNIGVSSTTSVAANSPYRQAVTTNARMQYLVTKAELNAAGINAATNITSLSFNATAAGAGTMSNYAISMANTSATALATTFLSPTFTTVYSSAYTVVSGVNLHTFSTPFAWDGTSNIVINICHTGPGGTTSTVSMSTPAAVSTTTVSGSTSCTVNTGGTTNANRPIMVLGSFSSAAITWLPITDLFTDAGATSAYTTGTAASTVYSKSTSTLAYTATATIGSCTKSNSTTVTRKPNTTIATQPISQTVCQGTSATFTVVGGNSASYLYQWKKDGIAIGSATNDTYTTAIAGSYTVEVVGDCGPLLTSNAAVLTVNPSNAITNITAALNPICATATTTLTANGVAGTNAVLTWWTGSNGTGTNLGTTPTITAGPGTYYARVTGDCGAVVEANYTINTIAVPTYANLQYPSSGAICLGGSYDTYGQVYQVGVTPGAGAGSGITAEFGYNATDTDPSTWTNWLATTYNVDSGNNDEYKNIFTPTTSGTYYYTFRYRQGTCDWIYGGYSVSGGGFWNGTSNVSGVLTVNPNPTASVSALNATICFNTDATFTLTGTSGAVVTYNINGASNTTATLTGGTATVTVANATATQTLYLVSVTIGTCTTSLSGSAVVSQGVATTWSAGAWDNGTPSSSTTTAIISSDYTTGVGLATGFTACSLIINTGAVVIVSSGDNITLNGGLTIQSGSFTLDNDANLIQNTTVTNTDNINVNRTTAALIRQDYALWSSPVAGQQLQAFSPMTLATRFYTYSPSGNIYVATSPTANFVASTGYLIRLPNNHPSTAFSWTGTFTGVPNNGDHGLTNITSGLFYATGNPYPSAINANAFITSNSITEPLYFWRKTNNTTTSSYATYTTMGGVSNSPADPLALTPNGYIQVGQGFIAKAATTSLNFTNSMRVSNSGPFLRTLENRSRIWLDLNGANGAFGQILVGYMPGATSGIDGAIDGRFFGDSQTALTSTINNEEFVIQGRAFPFETTDVVALGFKSELAGSYTISINHVDGLFETTNQDIYLKDNLTNTTTDLRAGSYTFATEAGVFNNRFEIVYAAPLAVNQNTFDANAVVVYHQNNQLVINTGKIMMANVAVYDISGRLIASKKNIKATETKINVGTTQQVLLVKITSTENGTVTKKVVN